MSTDRKYYMKAKGKLVEVSKEVYLMHNQTKRRALYLIERDLLHGVVSYHSQDMLKNMSEDITGEEIIHDKYAPTPEETAIDNIMNELLHNAINQLPDEEQELIQALFFDGYSLCEWSKKTKLPVMTIQNRKNKIIEKLRNIIIS